MEQLSLQRIAQMHPRVKELAKEAYLEAVQLTPAGVHPFITQTLRTFDESDKLYAQGRTKPGEIVTNAPGGRSMHNYGLALDFVNQVNGKQVWKVDHNWMIVVECFKKRGFTWGGDFKSIPDAPHFEMTFGLTWQKLLARHNQHLFIPGTKFVLI
jgi:peptidoglycan L-alanyl-D-glutamate endopeptidase CwlK